MKIKLINGKDKRGIVKGIIFDFGKRSFGIGLLKQKTKPCPLWTHVDKDFFGNEYKTVVRNLFRTRHRALHVTYRKLI